MNDRTRKAYKEEDNVIGDIEDSDIEIRSNQEWDVIPNETRLDLYSVEKNDSEFSNVSILSELDMSQSENEHTEESELI